MSHRLYILFAREEEREMRMERRERKELHLLNSIALSYAFLILCFVSLDVGHMEILQFMIHLWKGPPHRGKQLYCSSCLELQTRGDIYLHKNTNERKEK